MTASVLPLAAPIARFCHQLWDSEGLIDTINLPILFLSGSRDELVPRQQMEKLYSRSTSDHKVWREFSDGTHNDTVAQPGYMKAVLEFVEQVITRSSQAG